MLPNMYEQVLMTIVVEYMLMHTIIVVVLIIMGIIIGCIMMKFGGPCHRILPAPRTMCGMVHGLIPLIKLLRLLRAKYKGLASLIRFEISSIFSS